MNLAAILGPDFITKFREATAIPDDDMEAVNGICSADDVCAEDREPPTVVGMFDDVPMPRDPYRQTNPINQDDED